MLFWAPPAMALDNESCPPLSPNESSKAESYILEHVPTGEEIHLEDEFQDECDRVVRAEFLQKLITGEIIQIPQQGIRLSGIIVNEPFYVEYSDIPYEVWLDSSIFNDEVSLYSSHFYKNLTFYEGQFEKDITFDLVTVDKTLQLDIATFNGSASFYQVEIGKDITLSESTFNGTVSFDQAKIGNDMMLGNGTFNDTVSFYQAKIENDLILNESTFSHGASFYQAKIGNDLYMPDSKFTSTDPEEGLTISDAMVGGTVDISGTSFSSFTDLGATRIEKSFLLNNAQLDGSAYFNGMSIGELMVCSQAIFNDEVNLVASTIGSQLKCRDAQFNNTDEEKKVEFRKIQTQAIFFERSTFAGNVDFSYGTFTDRARFNSTVFMGGVDFTSAHFSGGDIQFNDARFESAESMAMFNRVQAEEPLDFSETFFTTGLDLSYSNLKDLFISGKNDSPIKMKNLYLQSTVINRDFSLTNIQISEMNAGSLNVHGPTIINNAKVKDRMDLQNASFETLSINFEKFEWPTQKDALQVRGMTYEDIDVGGQGLSEGTWKRLLDVFNDAAYSPQSYKALSQFLTDKGRPEWAAEVDLQMKNRERKDASPPFQPHGSGRGSCTFSLVMVIVLTSHLSGVHWLSYLDHLYISMRRTCFQRNQMLFKHPTIHYGIVLPYLFHISIWKSKISGVPTQAKGGGHITTNLFTEYLGGCSCPLPYSHSVELSDDIRRRHNKE